MIAPTNFSKLSINVKFAFYESFSRNDSLIFKYAYHFMSSCVATIHWETEGNISSRS